MEELVSLLILSGVSKVKHEIFRCGLRFQAFAQYELTYSALDFRDLHHELDHIDSICWSHCGTFISLRNRSGYPVYPPWTLPPRCLGSVPEFRMPRIIRPREVLHSMLFGSKGIYVSGLNEDGRFYLKVKDTQTWTGKVLLDQVLPDHLIDVTPIVVLDSPERPHLQLVFLCNDRAPEVMIIPETWSSLVARCIEKASKRLLQGLDPSIDSLAHLLELEADWGKAHKACVNRSVVDSRLLD